MAPPKRNEIERFLEKVDRSGSCWNWMARKDKDGYGEFQYNGHKERAHRVAFQLFIDDLNPGEVIRHTCDNPSCVKPAHLMSGTHMDNKIDAMARHRHAKETTHGMTKLLPEQIQSIYDDPRPQKEIAHAFGIGQSHVSRIKRQESWATLLHQMTSGKVCNGQHNE